MSHAKELNQKQQHYDLLHHRKRIAGLTELAAERRLSWHESEMLRQSQRYLAHPDQRTRCVDLTNTSYLAELDNFNNMERV